MDQALYAKLIAQSIYGKSANIGLTKVFIDILYLWNIHHAVPVVSERPYYCYAMRLDERTDVKTVGIRISIQRI